jgi:hypothetical protein
MEFVNPSGIPGNVPWNFVRYVVEIQQNRNISYRVLVFYDAANIYRF